MASIKEKQKVFILRIVRQYISGMYSQFKLSTGAYEGTDPLRSSCVCVCV